jgi:hypothetical protein
MNPAAVKKELFPAKPREPVKKIARLNMKQMSWANSLAEPAQ